MPTSLKVFTWHVAKCEEFNSLSDAEAFIKEIFPSIQGEGLFAGQAQVFLRFSRCNLDCSYCDTDHSVGKECHCYEDSLGKCSRVYPNPLSVEQVRSILKFMSVFGSTLVLTGGEPLLNVNFLRKLLPVLKADEWKILLETNGTLAENFSQIAQWIDILDMDIKLPSSGNQAPSWAEHQAFFENIPPELTAYLKLVITSTTKEEDLFDAAKMIRRLSPKRVIFLQPESKDMAKNPKRLSDSLMWTQQSLLQLLRGWDVRILPQLHKVLGVL